MTKKKNQMMIDGSAKVVLGNCIRVRNLDRKDGEPDTLVCIQVESENGKDEYPILMTEDDFHEIGVVDDGDSDGMVAGRVYGRKFGRSMRYCVKLNDEELGCFVASFEKWKWMQHFQMAATHPNSCTRKSLITDILD